MEILVFMRARSGRPAQGFKDWYVTDFASLVGRRCSGRHVANLAVEGPAELRPPPGTEDAEARYDVVAQLTLDDPAGFRAAFDGAELAEWADIRNAYRISETVVIDKEPPRTTSLPGFKIMREIIFHQDMPDSAARRSWTHHGALARKVHVGVTRYAQYWVEEHLSPNPSPVRGISDLYLPSWEVMARSYYDSPRGREEVTHDAGHFIESQLPRVYAQEHVLTA